MAKKKTTKSVKKKAVKTTKVSKKSTKKIVKKAKAKKPKVKIEMEDLYRLINRVQVAKKEVTFCVTDSNVSVVENVIKDIGLDFKRTKHGSDVVFQIFPSPVEEEPDDFNVFDFFMKGSDES